MFKKILVALDHSKADNVLLPQVKELAKLTQAEILLLHVSTGWAAQWQDNLNLSDSQEIKEDREYLGARGGGAAGRRFPGDRAPRTGRAGPRDSEDRPSRTLRSHRHGGPRTQVD